MSIFLVVAVVAQPVISMSHVIPCPPTCSSQRIEPPSSLSRFGRLHQKWRQLGSRGCFPAFFLHLTWVKQWNVIKLSPSHHHVYRRYVYHSQMGGLLLILLYVVLPTLLFCAQPRSHRRPQHRYQHLSQRAPSPVALQRTTECRAYSRVYHHYCWRWVSTVTAKLIVGLYHIHYILLYPLVG